MHLPTPTTHAVSSVPSSQYLTTFTSDTSTTLTQQSQPNILSIFTPPTTTPTNVQTSRRIVWQTPNVVMDDIPTTLVTVTVSTTAHATRWITLPASPTATATATATNSLLVSAIATQHATGTPAELADSGLGVPDWPPLLVIFLLCWVVVAWAVALVLCLATFPERVAWLDRVLGRLRRRGVGGNGERREHYAEQADDAGERRGKATVATGLGISFTKPLNMPRLRRPRSFDSDSLGMREPGPTYGDLAATAPLPSYGSFKMFSPDASPTRSDTEGERYQEDLETGNHEMRHCDRELQGQQQPDVGSIAGVLESVNALMDFVARNVARMVSDRVVDSAERGLLLPVRDEEREPVV